MKIALAILVAALFGLSCAQVNNKQYTFSDESNSYRIYFNEEVGLGRAFLTVAGFEGELDPSSFSNLSGTTEYVYLGVDATETLHISYYSHNVSRETASPQFYRLAVKLGETLTFTGELGGPNIELSFEQGENGMLTVTLVNANAFELVP